MKIQSLNCGVNLPQINLLVCLFKFMKLVQLAIVQVIGCVEDEKTSHIYLHEVQALELVRKTSKHCYPHVCSIFFH
jgi:predicted amidohydrolase